MWQPGEKPYEFVSFPPGSPRRSKVEGHHHFATNKLSGTLALRLTARRPVQVACGTQDVLRLKTTGDTVVAQDVTVRRRGEELHVLPSSSLKGVVRSVVEALSPSCVRVTSWRTRKALPRRLNACSRVDQLCPACRLFGMSGRARENYGGQVQVEDAVMIEGRTAVVRTPLLWTPARSRRGLPNRYLEGRETKGRKFYYHGTLAKGPDARLVASTGATFETQLHFENLTAGELGLLLIALGQHPDKPFLLKVGAAKPVGMGSVEVQVTGIELLGDVRRSGRAGAGIERLEGNTLRDRIQEWIDQAEPESLLISDALEELWAILRAENLSRPSPEEAY